VEVVPVELATVPEVLDIRTHDRSLSR